MLRYVILCLVAVLSFCRTGALAQQADTEPALTNNITYLKTVDFEDLFKVEVTTVSRRAERLLNTPSAVQVISNEEIARSGATSLPEALRLASNLQVSQVNARDWAISARGFNNTLANKLLVMIDGRSVYTPLFAGVFWDVQNLMLEDVERIEVISGPGATLWGANAVNGVVNVITKSAKETQGGLLSAAGGTSLNGFGALRYGDKISEDLYFRVYGFGFDRDDTRIPSGRQATNGWWHAQTGFRTDWLPESGNIGTVQGDFYTGRQQRPGAPAIEVNGQNVLGRFTRPFSDAADLTLQVYWDRTWRILPGIFSEELNTVDVDLQNRLSIGERNQFVWGAGYRAYLDRVGNSAALAFLPPEKNLQLFSGFLQDEMEIVQERLFVTLGSKFEHNDYSRFELQPSLRALLKVTERQSLWAAVSRAVRSPSRIDTEYFVPGAAPFFIVGGGERFTSERLIAYEIGYRAEITERLSAGVSTFFNHYDRIRSAEPVPGVPGQFIIANGLDAETCGAEFTTTFQVSDSWTLRGGYTIFEKSIGSTDADLNAGRGEGNDPHHQFVLQSMLNLPAAFQFDTVFRFVDALTQEGPTVPSYFTADLRLSWRPRPDLELAVVGQNLIENRHPEFGTLPAREEIPRSFYAKVTWKF